MSKTISAPKTSRERYLRQLQAAILRHGLYRGEVHADEIVTALPVPEGTHCNTVGAAFASLFDANLIEPVGFRRSERHARHKGISRLWRVCDTKGARRYLSALVASGDGPDTI